MPFFNERVPISEVTRFAEDCVNTEFEKQKNTYVEHLKSQGKSDRDITIALDQLKDEFRREATRIFKKKLREVVDNERTGQSVQRSAKRQATTEVTESDDHLPASSRKKLKTEDTNSSPAP